MLYFFTMKFQQQSFFSPISKSFGGTLQSGKRKTFRPLDPKSAIHLVLKSSRAKAIWSMLHRRNKTRIQDLMERLASENGIKVYQFVNVGNHLHLLVKIRSRDGFQKFLRVFTGRVALLVTGARKGNPQGKFWDALAFSRIVQWGKDFKRITLYFIKNELESLGLATGFSKTLTQRGSLILEKG
jgi:REP element-mobilizing transposase RayT